MASSIVQLATAEPVDLTGDANHTDVVHYGGFSVRESAGTPAVAAVNFRHGSVSGQIVGVLELAANESADRSLPGIIQTPAGVYVQVVTGEISGVLYNIK